MCGICGWLNLQGEVKPGVVEKMNNIAKYRGPDDEGYFFFHQEGEEAFIGKDSIELPFPLVSNATLQKYYLGLGHRRLSIIDLSESGHQPMTSKDGDLFITYNGEIYNYIELKEELQQEGFKFNSSSDTEVLLTAYKYWGESCVDHLNGMWAFAIWDKAKQKIFCSRDRLGAKPFYYYLDEENFIFSSEIKQLCQNPIIPRFLNEKEMITQIMWGIADYSEETLIKDIFSLRGGYNLIIHLDFEEKIKIKEIKKEKYWDIDIKKTNDPQKAIEKVFEIHKDAVHIRTRSDVPIGMLLSGGLDSSTLVAEVSEYFADKGISPEIINTYTSCYEDFKAGDEREYAEKVNHYCGVKQNLIFPDEKNTFDAFKDMIWHLEGGATFSMLGSFLTLREISKKGAKVLINGQGSDETMFGYERYYAWYLKDVLKNEGFIAFLKESKLASENSKMNLLEIYKLFLYFQLKQVRKTRCYNRMAKYITPEVKKAFKKNKEVYPLLFFNSLDELQYNEIRNTQLTHILRFDDREYMAFSMESRVPFIDYRYIEEAVRIPEKLKIQKGYTKYLLRKHIDECLPKEVVWRKNKMGWPSPSERWVKRFDERKIINLFENPRSKKYFNIEELKKLYKKSPSSYPVEKFIVMELFMCMFDVKVI